MMTEGTSQGLAQRDHTQGLPPLLTNPIALGAYESALISTTNDRAGTGREQCINVDG